MKSIIDKKTVNGKVFYKVWWKNYLKKDANMLTQSPSFLLLGVLSGYTANSFRYCSKKLNEIIFPKI